MKKLFIFLAIFLVMPLAAFAAPTLSFDPTPADTYHVYEGDLYQVDVSLDSYVEDTTITFYLTDPAGVEEEISTYTYTSNGEHVFGWDGKNDDGIYVHPGVYTLRISGKDNYGDKTNELTHTFTVTEEIYIDNVQAPLNINPQKGEELKVDFDLLTATGACMVLMVDGEVVDKEGPIGSGAYTLVWNGKKLQKFAPEGVYDWYIYSDSSLCGRLLVETDNLAEGSVAVGSAGGGQAPKTTPPVPETVQTPQTTGENTQVVPHGEDTDDDTAATTSGMGDKEAQTDSNLIVWPLVIVVILLLVLLLMLMQRRKGSFGDVTVTKQMDTSDSN